MFRGICGSAPAITQGALSRYDDGESRPPPRGELRDGAPNVPAPSISSLPRVLQETIGRFAGPFSALRVVNSEWHGIWPPASRFYGPLSPPQKFRSFEEWVSHPRDYLMAMALSGGLGCPAAQRIMQLHGLQPRDVQMAANLAAARGEAPVFRSVFLGCTLNVPGQTLKSDLRGERLRKVDRWADDPESLAQDPFSSEFLQILARFHQTPAYLVSSVFSVVHTTNGDVLWWDPRSSSAVSLRQQVGCGIGEIVSAQRAGNNVCMLDASGAVAFYAILGLRRTAVYRPEPRCVELIPGTLMKGDASFIRLEDGSIEFMKNGRPRRLELDAGRRIVDIHAANPWSAVVLDDGTAGIVDMDVDPPGVQLLGRDEFKGIAFKTCVTTDDGDLAFVGIDPDGHTVVASASGEPGGQFRVDRRDITSLHANSAAYVMGIGEGGKDFVGVTLSDGSVRSYVAEKELNVLPETVPDLAMPTPGPASARASAVSPRTGRVSAAIGAAVNLFKPASFEPAQLLAAGDVVVNTGRRQAHACRAAQLRATGTATLTVYGVAQTRMVCQAQRAIPGLKKYLAPAAHAAALPVYRIPPEKLKPA